MPKREKPVVAMIRLPAAIKDKLAAKAKAKNLSLNAYIVRLLTEEVQYNPTRLWEE